MKQTLLTLAILLFAIVAPGNTSQATPTSYSVIAEIVYESNVVQLRHAQGQFMCEFQAQTTSVMAEAGMTADRFATFCSVSGVRFDGSVTPEYGGMLDQPTGTITIPWSEPIVELYWSAIVKAVDVDTYTYSESVTSESIERSDHTINNFTLDGELDVDFNARMSVTSLATGKMFEGSAHLGVNIHYEASQETLIAQSYQEETHEITEVKERHATLVGARDVWIPTIPTITKFEFGGRVEGCDALDGIEARFGVRDVAEFAIDYEAWGTTRGNITVDVAPHKVVGVTHIQGFEYQEITSSRFVLSYDSGYRFEGSMKFELDYEHGGNVELQNQAPKDLIPERLRLDPPRMCTVYGDGTELQPTIIEVSAVAKAQGLHGEDEGLEEFEVKTGFDHEYGLY